LASTNYSKEELVAEMGAAFLCGHTGIVNTTIENSTAYIASWLTRLQQDVTFVIHAAAQARKAVDFILNTPADPRVSPQEEA
jgi:antirestriction protein ArdC